MNSLLQIYGLQDPNARVYSHSTTIAFDGTGAAPHYHETTDELRRVGDARETRRTVRDTHTGEERMSIGHHLGGQSHIVEKRRVRGGPVEQEQQFVNLREEEAAAFDRQFTTNNNRLTDATQEQQPTNSEGGGRRRRILPQLPQLFGRRWDAILG